MRTADDLRKLAKELEEKADAILGTAEHDPNLFNLVVKSLAIASSTLEKTAAIAEENFLGPEVTPEQLEEMAAIAEEFDASGDPMLQKQAAVIDEILLTIGAPKDALAQAKRAYYKELDRLRKEHRHNKIEELYTNPKEALDKQNMVAEQRKAVESQVKEFRPLEAPLSTRYPPDMPGGHLTRITDGVYQDVLTGKTYDYRAGYTTNKGNKVPGSSVDRQIPDLGTVDPGHTMFDTRETIQSRYAGDDGFSMVKEALLGKA